MAAFRYIRFWIFKTVQTAVGFSCISYFAQYAIISWLSVMLLVFFCMFSVKQKRKRSQTYNKFG